MMRCLGITCLGLVIIAVAAGVVMYMNAESWSRQGAAWVGEVGAEAIIDTFNLPPEEKEKAMAPLRELFAGVRDGSVSLEQMGNVLAQIAEGGSLSALMARAFEVNYVEPSGLSEDAKKEARVTLSRFVKGAMDQAIPQDTIESVTDMVSIETVDAEGNTTRTFKDSLTDEELAEALAVMKQAADDANIPVEKFEFDVADMIQKAIDRGLQKTAAGTAPVGAEDSQTSRPRPRPGQPATTAP